MEKHSVRVGGSNAQAPMILMEFLDDKISGLKFPGIAQRTNW